jgi:hypothetical protein
MKTAINKRGYFLTTLIALEIISTIYAFLSFDRNNYIKFYGNVPEWYFTWLTALYFIYLAIYVGIWLFKRIAVYAFFCLGIINMLIFHSIIDTPKQWIPFQVVVVILFAGLWYFAVKRKWSKFK